MKTQTLKMNASRIDRIFAAQAIARNRLYATHKRAIIRGVGECLIIARETGGRALGLIQAKYSHNQIALEYIDSIILA